MSRIVIFHEKHGSRVYDASVPENLHNACKMILHERIEAGGWYDEKTDAEWLTDVRKYLARPYTERLTRRSQEPALYELLDQRHCHEYEGIVLDDAPVVDADGNIV